MTEAQRIGSCYRQIQKGKKCNYYDPIHRTVQPVIALPRRFTPNGDKFDRTR